MQYIIFGVARSGVRDTPRGFDKRQLCVRPGHTVLTITVFAIQADEFPMPISWTTVESQANSGGPALAHRSLNIMLQTVFLFMINRLRRVNEKKVEWEESAFPHFSLYCITRWISIKFGIDIHIYAYLL